MNIPSKNDINPEAPKPPPEGRYDVTITAVEAARSNKGYPQLVFTYTVDNGEEAGHQFKEWVTIWDNDGPVHKHPSWRKIRCISDACGFDFESKDSYGAFAAQWPLNELRLSIDVVHSYSGLGYIDTTNKYNYNSKSPRKNEKHQHKVDYLELTREEYESWPNEEKSIRAEVQDSFSFDPLHIYQKPQGDPELEFSADGYASTGDGQAGEEPTMTTKDEGDDPLPF